MELESRPLMRVGGQQEYEPAAADMPNEEVHEAPKYCTFQYVSKCIIDLCVFVWGSDHDRHPVE